MAAAGKIFYKFLTGLDPEMELPESVSIINPYHEPEVKRVLRQFCDTFYAGANQRMLILGINPGRFGAGVTGVPFTDPIALEQSCGIANSFQAKYELSSRFIYEMITAFGGTTSFYDHFLLSAVCPLGFLKGTTNYNYYDSAILAKATSGFIQVSLKAHASWNVNHSTVICLGKKNASCLEAFNKGEKLFKNIITLDHPRYIMQYRLKRKDEYIRRYCDVLQTLL